MSALPLAPPPDEEILYQRYLEASDAGRKEEAGKLYLEWEAMYTSRMTPEQIESWNSLKVELRELAREIDNEPTFFDGSRV